MAAPVPGFPTGGEKLASAVYATSSSTQWETNTDFNTTAAEAWLHTLDKQTLDTAASASIGWGAVEYILQTPVSSTYSMLLEGTDALAYCSTLLNEDGTKTCRVHVTLVVRYVRAQAQSLVRMCALHWLSVAHDCLCASLFLQNLFALAGTAPCAE